MAKNWDAVAEAINTRLDELQMTQNELSIKSGVSTATLRELQHNRNPRRRTGRLLEAVSVALDWPPSHLGSIVDGAPAGTLPQGDLVAEVHRLGSELAALQHRVRDLEARL